MVRGIRNLQQSDRFTPSWVALLSALLALAALPFFGFLVGRFVTHTMEERYVVASLIPFIIAVSVALKHRFQSDRVFYPSLALLLLIATGTGVAHMSADRAKSQRILGKMTISPQVVQELATHPSERLYVQNTSDLFLNSYYAPSALVQQRLSAIYDSDRELAVRGNDTDAVTANYLRQFQPFSTIRYPDFIAQRDPLLLHNKKAGLDWVSVDLQSHQVPMQLQGSALGNDVFRVTHAPPLLLHPSPPAR